MRKKSSFEINVHKYQNKKQWKYYLSIKEIIK